MVRFANGCASRFAPPTVAFEDAEPGAARSVGGVKLCWCPPGRFRMGSPVEEPQRPTDEDAVHVTLTRGFWMGK